MSAPTFTQTASVEIAADPGDGLGLILDPTSWSVTLDESRTPYIQAKISAPVPTPFDPAQVNPYTGLQALLLITRTQVHPVIAEPEENRMLRLLLHEVTVDHASGVMSLVCVSGEAAWLDAGRGGDVPALTSLQGAINGLDARTLVNAYLASPPDGPALALNPGAFTGTLLDDTDGTFWRWVNTATNPDLASTATGYSGSSATVVRDTSWGHVGSTSLRVTPTALNSYVEIAGGGGAMREGMVAGSSYLARATMRVRTALSATAQTNARRLQIVIKDAAGSYRTLAESEQASTVVGSETELEVSFTIPEGTTEVWRRIIHGHSSGDTQWDAFMLVRTNPNAPGAEFPDEIRYFDSSNVVRRYTTSGGTYGYTTTHPNYTLSAGPTLEFKPYSAIAQPDPDSYYWDVIAQIMQASGTRVFCDEAGGWNMLTIGAQNANIPHVLDLDWLIRADEVQSMQRDELGRPLWADSIVVDFIDQYGLTRTVRQQLGATRRKTWRTQAFASRRLIPAQMEAIALRMLQTVALRERTFDLEAIAILDLTPGDVIVLDLGGGDPLEVIASSVTLTSEGTMQLTTRAPEA